MYYLLLLGLDTSLHLISDTYTQVLFIWVTFSFTKVIFEHLYFYDFWVWVLSVGMCSVPAPCAGCEKKSSFLIPKCCIVGNWTCFSSLKTFRLSSKRLLQF